eukprot:1731691-Karenia_brevis.AAC.1
MMMMMMMMLMMAMTTTMMIFPGPCMVVLVSPIQFAIQRKKCDQWPGTTGAFEKWQPNYPLRATFAAEHK